MLIQTMCMCSTRCFSAFVLSWSCLLHCCGNMRVERMTAIAAGVHGKYVDAVDHSDARIGTRCLSLLSSVRTGRSAHYVRAKKAVSTWQRHSLPFTFGEQRGHRLLSCLWSAAQCPKKQLHNPKHPGGVEAGEEGRPRGCFQQAFNPGL